RDKDTLTHLIVHDLRSPLTGLTGAIELVRACAKGGSLDDAVHYCDLAMGTAGRLQAMISDLLATAKLEEGRMTLELVPVPLPELLAEVEREHAPSARQKRVQLSVRGGAGVVRLDRMLLRR